jgi:hypothetical protein
MRRRPSASSPAARAAVVTPRIGATDLDPMTATPPRTGWTLAAARSAAARYADEHPQRYSADGVARAAFLALAAVTPSLHRADVEERLAALPL